ncbi:MAG: two pore domain potassium channel family protein [Silvibacterium sp.]|nr:two pore domain potassium channel family protein [Silvibacterium sp.]
MPPSTDSIQDVPVARKSPPAPDRLLLLSLLSVIVFAPILDHGEGRKVILTALTFIPVILATIQLSEKEHWLWPSVALMSITIVFGVTSTILHNRALVALKWGTLAAFFALSVTGLFSYLRKARSIQQSHLYTAISVYLLLGMLWFCLYATLDAAAPGSFQHSSSAIADRQSELLYFSLVTLTTIGYGDILPVAGEARMLAALEGVVGVLYVAITVALLVSGFKRTDSSSPE